MLRSFLILLVLVTAVLTLPQNSPVGYTDTPMLPGLAYHVHDPARPHPAVVTPGMRVGDAPSDAVVLFDGRDLSHWMPARQAWKVENGYFEVVPKAGDMRTKETFGDVQPDVEWEAACEARNNSQDRGNSGIFLQGRYEVQVLDSHDNPTYADGQAGAIYGQWTPLVDPAREAREWE